MFAFLNKRFLTVAALAGAAYYVWNNYQVQGLDGIRLAPRSAVTAAPGGLPAWSSGTPSLPGGSAFSSTPLLSNQPLASGGPLVPANPGLSSPGLSSPAWLGNGAAPGLGASAGFGAAQNFGAAQGFGATQGMAAAGATAAGGFPGAVAPTDRGLNPLGVPENGWEAWLPGAASATAAARSVLGLPAGNAGAAPVQDATIRIASFNLTDFDSVKRERLVVRETLLRILPLFDLIAVQQIRSPQDNVLPELVATLNATGRRFDFLIGPRVGRGEPREQFAFIFDTDRIETDRYQLYTVDDPEDLLQFEPLVGWFRAKTGKPESAFTFTLACLRLSPDFAQSEFPLLPELARAIARDGRGEDDVLLAGDFGMSAAQVQHLPGSGLRAVLDGVATDTRGTRALDNILYFPAATTEFTGRSGAVDFLRQWNLGLEQALEVSAHLPVWAEFLATEGGRPGQVANHPLQPPLRGDNR
jgi:deoxyribonuclease-1-like protein